MVIGNSDEEDHVAIRDLPGASILRLMAAIAAGSGLFFFAIHMLGWILGWPGPFVWFGSQSRWGDILGASLAVPVTTFTASLFGLGVVKSLALLDWCNFRLRVR